MKFAYIIIFPLIIIQILTFTVYDDIKYNNHDEIISKMQEIHMKCPDITHLYHLNYNGKDETNYGNKLYVLAFGLYPKYHVSNIPEFKYVANMHGNEPVGREMLIYLMQYLCQDYINNKYIAQWLVNHTRIHLLPTMNPDGWQNAVGMKKHELLGRTNANGVDLNRNFPDLDATYFYRNFDINESSIMKDDIFPKLEHETLLVMNWMKQIPFVLSANMHEGDLVANYPFDRSITKITQYTPTPDEDVFVKLSLAYADYHKQMGELNCSQSSPSFHDGITNGANWYSVSNGMQDYNYMATNCFEITLELNCFKYPPASDLPQLWLNNRNSLINYMLQAHSGVKGFVFGVSDEELGPLSDVAIKAFKLFLPCCLKQINHDVYSNKDGDFYRLLDKGNYIIAAFKEGYKPSFKYVKLGDMPDLASMPYHEAKKIDFLLLADSANKSNLQSLINESDLDLDYDAILRQNRLNHKLSDIMKRYFKNENIFQDQNMVDTRNWIYTQYNL